MKLCRREGYNLFGTEKYNLEDNHREVKRGKKLSEFGVLLRKKQAAKRQYGVTEKQFARMIYLNGQRDDSIGNTDSRIVFLGEEI